MKISIFQTFPKWHRQHSSSLMMKYYNFHRMNPFFLPLNTIIISTLSCRCWILEEIMFGRSVAMGHVLLEISEWARIIGISHRSLYSSVNTRSYLVINNSNHSNMLDWNRYRYFRMQLDGNIYLICSIYCWTSLLRDSRRY